MSVKNLYTNNIKIYQQLNVNSTNFVSDNIKNVDFDLSINGLETFYFEGFEYEIVGDFLIGLFKLSTQVITTGANISNTASIVLPFNDELLPRYDGNISNISVLFPPTTNNEYLNMSYNSTNKVFELKMEFLSNFPISTDFQFINVYVFWLI